MDLDKRSPSARDLKIFPLVFLALFALIALLAWKRPGGLLVATSILTAAWIAALLFDPKSRRRNAFGFVLPALLGSAGWLASSTELPVAVAALALGGAGALVLALSRGASAAVYGFWMRAAEPIGWTISHAVLGIIWYFLVTPVGLLMRLFGRDPIDHELNPDAKTYWVEHRTGTDVSRYLKQY